MARRKVKIVQFNLIWTIGFLLFFKPASYVTGLTVSRFLNFVVLCISIGMVILALLLFGSGYKMKKPVLWLLILCFWVLAGSSVLNLVKGNPIDPSDVAVYFSSTLCFVLLCDIGCWYSPERTCRIFLIVGILMCSLNAISMFIFKGVGGLYQETVTVNNYEMITSNYYLLARDNASYFWSWPVLVMTWFYYYRFNTKKNMRRIALAYTFLLAVSYIYVWSVLAAVACLCVPLILLLLMHELKKEKTQQKKKNWFIKLIKLKLLWPLGLIFNFMLSRGIIIQWFAPVIENVFNKKLTLSGRTFIWERAYAEIAKSPLIGYGCEPMDLSIEKIILNHAHNMFLEIMYRGGIIALILFIIAFILISNKADRIKNNVLSKFLILMVFIFIICSSVEFAFYRYHYLIILVFLCHTELFSTKTRGLELLHL